MFLFHISRAVPNHIFYTCHFLYIYLRYEFVNYYGCIFFIFNFISAILELYTIKEGGIQCSILIFFLFFPRVDLLLKPFYRTIISWTYMWLRKFDDVLLGNKSVIRYFILLDASEFCFENKSIELWYSC